MAKIVKYNYDINGAYVGWVFEDEPIFKTINSQSITGIGDLVLSGSVTKESVEAVLTGEISTHTHTKAIGTEVTAGTNDTKFITPKAFADSSIKANHDWMLNLMQGNANGIDTDVVDATIVVFFEGEMMQISYSNLLAQLQSDLGL